MMPRVVIEAAGGPRIESDEPRGGRLLDVCDRVAAPVAFSCRSATCGSCRIDVLEGAGLLEPPADDELETLAAFGDDPSRRRLACRACVRPGALGRLRLRAAAG